MIYFFDTSALQHRYIDGPKARGIRWVVSNRHSHCFIADLTVLEISSTLARHCRRNSLSRKEYSRLDQRFWRDVIEGRLVIRQTGMKEYLRARDLLRYAGVEKARKIASADALIAAACLEFALSEKERVTFCLEDRGLYNVLRDVSAYAKAIRFHFIGTTS